MNFISKILGPKILVLVSNELINSYRGARFSYSNRKKLLYSQIVTVGSCNIIAGCCFSRQSSDEEVLLPNDKAYTTDLSSNTEILTKMGDFEPKFENVEVENVVTTVMDKVSSCTAEPQLKRIKTESSSSCDSSETKSIHKIEPHLKQISVKNFVGQDVETVSSNITCQSKMKFETDEIFLVRNVNEPKPSHITKKQLKKIKNKSTEGVKKKYRSATGQIGDQVKSPIESTTSQKGKLIEKPRKERPNYFVAIRICNDQIIQAVKEVQDHILEQERRLKNSMTKLETLHITLMVMSIKDQETLDKAKWVLGKIHEEYNADLSKNPIHLEFRGLDHFKNKVLYADLLQDDSFTRLISMQQRVEKHYEDASIFTTDTRKGFTPHLTVAKIDFTDHRGVKKINPLFYEDFNDQYFGSQRVESIQLLKMTGPKTETGYYSGYELVFSAYNQNSGTNSLKNLLSIDEQKKDIKEKINKLLRENLK